MPGLAPPSRQAQQPMAAPVSLTQRPLEPPFLAADPWSTEQAAFLRFYCRPWDWGRALVACLVDSSADPHITCSTFGCNLVLSRHLREAIGLRKRQLRAAWAPVPSRCSSSSSSQWWSWLAEWLRVAMQPLGIASSALAAHGCRTDARLIMLIDDWHSTA